jgi:hypothetical protein
MVVVVVLVGQKLFLSYLVHSAAVYDSYVMSIYAKVDMSGHLGR